MRKLSAVDVDAEGLAADERIGEIDLDLDPRAVIGAELGEGIAHLDPDRLLDPDVAAGLGKGLDAGLVDRIDESVGAAVHDRDFIAVDLDHGVVDVERAERRHQVLDRRHRDAIGADGGAHVGGIDITKCGRDLAIPAVIEIGPVEIDAAVSLGRMKSDRDLTAAVNAHPFQCRPLLERRLRPVAPSRHAPVPAPISSVDRRICAASLNGTGLGISAYTTSDGNDLPTYPAGPVSIAPSAHRRIED